MAQMGRERPMNRRTPTPAGFTLIEIMLALGVLGVGMIMVAAIFPAAIYQTRAADRATHAVLICDNARATLQLKATEDAINTMWASGAPENNVASAFAPVKIDDPARDLLRYEASHALTNIAIHAEDARYPTGPLVADINDRQGWVALVRHMPGTQHDYQFVVIAYRTFDGMDYQYDYTDRTGGKDVADPDTWPRGVAWCDGRGRPALVRIADTAWPDELDQLDPAIEDVTITQDDTGCFVYVSESSNADALQFISLDSPVILDGWQPPVGQGPTIPADWGRFPTIMAIEDEIPGIEDAEHAGDPFEDPVTGETSIRCRLSGDLFAEDDDPDNPDHPRRCGIWVMPGAGFRTPSPAIGAASFRMVLPN